MVRALVTIRPSAVLRKLIATRVRSASHREWLETVLVMETAEDRLRDHTPVATASTAVRFCGRTGRIDRSSETRVNGDIGQDCGDQIRERAEKNASRRANPNRRASISAHQSRRSEVTIRWPQRCFSDLTGQGVGRTSFALAGCAAASSVADDDRVSFSGRTSAGS
jgi:hypothetical protein